MGFRINQLDQNSIFGRIFLRLRRERLQVIKMSKYVLKIIVYYSYRRMMMVMIILMIRWWLSKAGVDV